jgi:hypothetical protein
MEPTDTLPCSRELDIRAILTHMNSADAKTKLKLNSVAFSPQANYTDRRLLAKLVQTFADRGCRVVSAMDPPSINSVFLTGAATFSFK